MMHVIRALIFIVYCISVLVCGSSYPTLEADLLHRGYVQHESPFRDKSHFQKESEVVLLHKPYKRVSNPFEWMKQLEDNHKKLKKIERNPPIGSLPDDYFRFIPTYIGSVLPGKQLSWSSPCFGKIVATSTIKYDNNGKFAGGELYIDVHEKSSMFCDDGYLLATVESFHVHYFEFVGNNTFKFVGDLSDTAKWDIQNYGFRIFRFEDDVTTTLVDIWETLQLFLLALIGKGVPSWTAEDNIKFLKEYANWDVQTRTTDLVTIPEDQIQSGAFLGIIRMDGLDPMLAWGMGSHTGHTAITLRVNGSLYVCESTVKDNYWPTDGIQITPWQQWLKQAHAASFNVVILPLSKEYQSKFDDKKAYEYFKTVEGLPYGFHNMLFGWIDTANNNYPPPLDSHLVMVFMVLLNALVKDITSPDPTTFDFWSQALNHRLGTHGLEIDEVYAEAGKRGLAFTDLVTIVEEDDWIYDFNGGVKGTASVCNVLVMRMYKAAGIFGNITEDIQGTEFTNWDVYSMNIFDGNWNRPQQCVSADPNLPYCQLMGKYRMDLNNYNQYNPFPHMREHCPGQPPDYKKPENC